MMSVVTASPSGESALIAFEPSPERAVALDTRMRARLAESLRHIFEEASGKLPFDEVAVGHVVARLEAGWRAPPQVFGIYYDLARALLAGNEEAARPLLAELAGADDGRGEFAIVPFAEGALGATTVPRFSRMMNADPTSPLVLDAPTRDHARLASEAIIRARGLIEKAEPRLAAEMRALVTRIFLAVGGAAGRGFGAASSFTLWGGLFMNIGRERSPVQLLETLVHESAHTLLFALAIDDALVENPDSERFHSPLRRDPRPMEGVYHATYVCARVHYAMAALLRSGVFGKDDEADALRMIEANTRGFHDGIGVVEAHGRLTSRGAAIIEAAGDYMAKAA